MLIKKDEKHHFSKKNKVVKWMLKNRRKNVNKNQTRGGRLIL